MRRRCNDGQPRSRPPCFEGATAAAHTSLPCCRNAGAHSLPVEKEKRRVLENRDCAPNLRLSIAHKRMMSRLAVSALDAVIRALERL
jgi:hypothetical protein